MIVALLNQKGGVGKRTLALHLAGQWSREGESVTLVDAYPKGSALDRSEQRGKDGFPRLFGVLGLARDTLPRAAPELARGADRVVIDGPPRVAGLMRSALLSADLVLSPAQPSPFDGWASGEKLQLIREARIFHPRLVARFVHNRCAPRTIIARQTAETLAKHDLLVLAAQVGQRVVFADADQTGRPVYGRDDSGLAATEIAALARSQDLRGMSKRTSKRGFPTRPGDPDSWVRALDVRPARSPQEDFSARLTIDATPALRGRIKVTAFRNGVTVAEMLRALLEREYPDDSGAAS